MGTTIVVGVNPAPKTLVIDGETMTGIATEEMEGTRDVTETIGGIGITNDVGAIALPHDLGQGHLSQKIDIRRKKKDDHANGLWIEDIKKRGDGWIDQGLLV